MSEGDRSLRDELERLQARARALETELATPHAPSFLAHKDTLLRAIGVERDGLHLEEKSLATARAAEREAQRLVDGLDARGRAYNQQTLDLLPMLVLGAASCVALSALVESGLDKWQLGFGCSLALGLLFGPRVLGRLQPGAAAAEPKPASRGGAARSLAFMLSLFGGLFAASINLSFWTQVFTTGTFQPVAGLGGDGGVLVGQTLLGAAVLLSLGALHRAAPEDTAGRGASRRVALASFVLLASLPVVALPNLLEVLRNQLGAGAMHRWALSSFGIFAPWVPFGLSLAARWKGPRARPQLLAASLLCTLTMFAVTFSPDPARQWETVRLLTTVVTALEFGALGAVLGFDAGREPWPRARLALIGGALAGSLACLIALLG